MIETPKHKFILEDESWRMVDHPKMKPKQIKEPVQACTSDDGLKLILDIKPYPPIKHF